MAATRPFDVDFGLAINGSTSLLFRTGPPAGTDADAAPGGALWIDGTSFRLYQKGANGAGPELWQLIGADTNWRGEVEVRDNVATVLPTFTPATNATVDGETIDDQERVLFSALTVNPNIHIYDKSAGSFVESTNEETAGDTTFVIRGTDAGKKFVFNGTAWVQNDQASVDEFGFIHTFIGKSGFGSETPTYSSTNVVTNGTSLEAAIGDLDAFVAALVTLATNTLTGVSGANTADSVLVDNVAAVKWEITIRQGTDIFASEVFATHDGTTGGDAAAVDFTQFAKLRIGSPIAGIDVDVDLSGAGVAQVLRLRTTTTAAADVHITRIPVNF